MANNKNIKGFVNNLKQKIFKGLSMPKKSKKSAISDYTYQKSQRESSEFIQEYRRLHENVDIDISLLDSAKNVYRQIIEILREMNYDGLVTDDTMMEFSRLSRDFSDIVEAAKDNLDHKKDLCNEEDYAKIKELEEKINSARNVINNRHILDSDSQRRKGERLESAKQLSLQENNQRMGNIDIR